MQEAVEVWDEPRDNPPNMFDGVYEIAYDDAVFGGESLNRLVNAVNRSRGSEMKVGSARTALLNYIRVAGKSSAPYNGTIISRFEGFTKEDWISSAHERYPGHPLVWVDSLPARARAAVVFRPDES